MTLVNWPSWDPDGGYHDSGEGGMFAYAVWPQLESECIVDTNPLLSRGDALVAAHGPISGTFAEQTNSNGTEWSDATSHTAHIHSLERSFGTVVFLGSTAGSFYSDARGEYFAVTEESLTEACADLMNSLTLAYGVAPTFVTYLDT